jgi:hypothetical protein
LHSTDSSFSGADESPLPANVQERTNSTTSQPVMTTKQDDDRSSNSSGETQHHKLTREDSERPIASEKIKKKSNKDHPTGNMTFMSVVRYYTEKLRQSTSKKKPEGSTNRGYVQQQLESNDSHKYRKAQSYAHFLAPAGSLLDEANEMDKDGYDPFFLDDDSYGQYGLAPGSLVYNDVYL